MTGLFDGLFIIRSPDGKVALQRMGDESTRTQTDANLIRVAIRYSLEVTTSSSSWQRASEHPFRGPNMYRNWPATSRCTHSLIFLTNLLHPCTLCLVVHSRKPLIFYFQ